MRPTIHTAASCATAPPAPWQGALRRHVTVLLLLKFAALALLWLLCFSPAHRRPVDAAAAAARLAPPPAAAAGPEL